MYGDFINWEELYSQVNNVRGTLILFKYKKQLLKIEKWSRDGSAKKQTNKSSI